MCGRMVSCSGTILPQGKTRPFAAWRRNDAADVPVGQLVPTKNMGEILCLEQFRKRKIKFAWKRQKNLLMILEEGF